MSEYPAWQAFQGLVRESVYNRVTVGAMIFTAKAALAEQVARAETAEAKNERLESCLRIWAGNLFPMATPEQNTKRIAAVKRLAAKGSGV